MSTIPKQIRQVSLKVLSWTAVTHESDSFNSWLMFKIKGLLYSKQWPHSCYSSHDCIWESPDSYERHKINNNYDICWTYAQMYRGNGFELNLFCLMSCLFLSGPWVYNKGWLNEWRMVVSHSMHSLINIKCLKPCKKTQVSIGPGAIFNKRVVSPVIHSNNYNGLHI